VSGEERPEDVLVTADDGIVDAMAGEALMLDMSSRTADFREGLRAFSERRPARFEGR
jgi:2-(1,2-epoxy-1,2-dihydrophenyl)acetyl-CoA isomerase